MGYRKTLLSTSSRCPRSKHGTNHREGKRSKTTHRCCASCKSCSWHATVSNRTRLNMTAARVLLLLTCHYPDPEQERMNAQGHLLVMDCFLFVVAVCFVFGCMSVYSGVTVPLPAEIQLPGRFYVCRALPKAVRTVSSLKADCIN